jgi:putative DNA methylase
MPDHWHALIWPQYPLMIEQVLHDAKKIMTLRMHARRGTSGPFWQHQYWDRFVRHQKEFGGAPGLHAPESGQEESGDAARGLALVKLQ